MLRWLIGRVSQGVRPKPTRFCGKTRGDPVTLERAVVQGERIAATLEVGLADSGVNAVQFNLAQTDLDSHLSAFSE